MMETKPDINKGWTLMEAKLNAEMPKVRKRNRRPVFWLILFSVLSAVLLGGYYFIYFRVGDNPEFDMITIAEKSFSDDRSKDSKLISEGEGSYIAVPNIANDSDLAKDIGLDQTENKKNNRNELMYKNRKANDIKTELMTFSTAAYYNDDHRAKLKDLNEIDTEYSTLRVDSSAYLHDVDIQGVSHIEVKGFLVERQSDFEWTIGNIDTSIFKSSSQRVLLGNNRIFASGGLLLSQHSGSEFGIAYERIFLNTSWGLSARSGMYLGRINLASEISEDRNYFSNESTAGQVGNTQNTVNLNLPTSFTIIAPSLSLSYNTSRRFSVMAGVQYVLRHYRGEGLEYDITDTKEEQISISNLDDNEIINKSDLRLQISAGYSFKSGLELGIQYSQSTSPLINEVIQPNSNILPASLMMVLAYRF